MTMFESKTAGFSMANPMMSLAERFRQRRMERQTRAALNKLPDDILKDIGLSRSDISRVARQTSHTPYF
ncbi:DUF1127 domain-containing protein [Pseudoruegeria sp. HB172150]|uniref:DUF1127 domain-containing protein n=1 Tax=Pseudoruegeria sp. HB172150 TaxID=2721164 RepID=UPI00155231B4|nr:DUF1127 domain-containing protein [Pseudoruegeria sp. HB172150]